LNSSGFIHLVPRWQKRTTHTDTMASTEQPKEPLGPVSNPVASTATPVYDLVCIGFGPAQIATAIANRESKTPSKVLFVEQKTAFSWHAGTHVARARMDSPFVYDLATIRNPRSAFSYVNYLLTRKRLIEFANSDRLNPLRVEFADYLQWCAGQFKEQVRYGSEAVQVVPISEDGTVRAWKVVVRNKNGALSVVCTKSVVAPSPASNVSKQQSVTTIDFLAGQRIISMDDYQSRRNDLRGANEPRLNVAVVGSGRQTAEILDDLLSCPRLGDITVVTEDESLTPLRILSEQEPPQPQLCSIWAKPSCDQKGSVTGASELVQTIYMRAYEKQVASRGQYGLHVVVGKKDAAEPCSNANFIIRDTATIPMPSTELLQSLDTLVLGCRSKGDSLEEVQFKRGAVAEECRIFLMSANSEGGRSLAKDIAMMAGHVVKAMSPATEARRDGVLVQARI
jgi:L-ornithine N5-oxygenase